MASPLIILNAAESRLTTHYMPAMFHTHVVYIATNPRTQTHHTVDHHGTLLTVEIPLLTDITTGQIKVIICSCPPKAIAPYASAQYFSLDNIKVLNTPYMIHD